MFYLMQFFFMFVCCRFKNVKMKMGIAMNNGRVERIHQVRQSTTLLHFISLTKLLANPRRLSSQILMPMESKRVLLLCVATSVVHTRVRKSLWFHSTTMASTSTPLLLLLHRLQVPMAYSSPYFYL